MSQRPTIRDLAKRLGMSKSTVQRALSESGSISPQAQQRVVDAARELGYQRDPLFSILGSRGRRTATTSLRIAYISRLGSPGLGQKWRAGVDVFEGAKARGEMLGYSVERVQPDELGAGKRLMDVLYHRGYVGVLLSQMRSPDHEAILANTHLPVVCCGRIDPLPLHTVQPDIVQMTKLAWKHFIQAGYRRIGPAICTHKPPPWRMIPIGLAPSCNASRKPCARRIGCLRCAQLSTTGKPCWNGSTSIGLKRCLDLPSATITC